MNQPTNERMNETSADVLIVGGGPAGAAAAIQLGRAGHDVVIVERGGHGRSKVCGELVTPRAVAAIDRLGVGSMEPFHKIERVRLTSQRDSTAIAWPSHDDYGQLGYVVARTEFDQLIVDTATAAGARLLGEHEAVAPIVERGFVRGAHIRRPDRTTFELRTAYTVVADGANSRFGRALGTFRAPTWPHAIAHRGIYRSESHAASEIELVLDIRDRIGTPITGYGWMFPRGDGTANVGVLIMSTSPSFRVINPATLLERFVADQGPKWGLEDGPLMLPAGGRVPLGNSVGPESGPTYLVAGDAAGAANPMSGAGIESALETGALAGDVLSDALADGSADALQDYPKLLEDRYGTYYKVGRVANRIMGSPALVQRLAGAASQRPHAADALVRLAGNELRDGRGGSAELIYRIARSLSLIAPDD
jgi:geranylgeranyl reductase family protein